MKQKKCLNEEILIDEIKVSLIYEFLEQTNTWHTLCRKRLANSNVNLANEPFSKSSEYYPYEKMTFTFLLYYDFSSETWLETSNLFVRSLDLYEKMLKKENQEKELLDSFKIRNCISSIFATIARNKDMWDKIQKEYIKFPLVKELNDSLPINSIEKKNTKI